MDTVISKYVDIPGMNNTRDLGGMRTKDGRKIRSDMLYRSAKLSDLKDPDPGMRNPTGGSGPRRIPRRP